MFYLGLLSLKSSMIRHFFLFASSIREKKNEKWASLFLVRKLIMNVFEDAVMYIYFMYISLFGIIMNDLQSSYFSLSLIIPLCICIFDTLKIKTNNFFRMRKIKLSPCKRVCKLHHSCCIYSRCHIYMRELTTYVTQ